jgi:hypothetical protein
MKKIFKFILYLVIFFIIFAFLPPGFLNRLKTFFSTDIFFATLKKGFNNFINFITDITGFNFYNTPYYIKNTLGIDIFYF